MDELRAVESDIAEYHQRASRRIFPNYLKLASELDSNAFCEHANNYDIGQSLNCYEGYGGPTEQGLTAGIAYLLTYQTLFINKIANYDFTDDLVTEELLASNEVSFIGNRLVSYMQPTLELQIMAYEDDLASYLSLLTFLVWLKTGGFIMLFILLFLFVFRSLVNRLTKEIWLNRGMLNVIPRFILEENALIQHYVWNQKAVI
eukprot:TRINITY_DN10776_c0_g4_i1.p1 TRINITY_DN10776_c0_g4~~TRINITY_DN10776_c0_g4_i1.p1  ORF type:complete len:203 (+),score=55.38 TRINITY_DN10776_c0_g4_i1:476-1084(+)